MNKANNAPVKAVPIPKNVNRVLYFGFLALSAWLFYRGDYAMAFSNFAIGLCFDPFDAKVMWTSRPMYQKVWLFVNVILLIAGMGWMWLHR